MIENILLDSVLFIITIIPLVAVGYLIGYWSGHKDGMRKHQEITYKILKDFKFFDGFKLKEKEWM